VLSGKAVVKEIRSPAGLACRIHTFCSPVFLRRARQDESGLREGLRSAVRTNLDFDVVPIVAFVLMGLARIAETSRQTWCDPDVAIALSLWGSAFVLPGVFDYCLN
jgi:hypothetical protein